MFFKDFVNNIYPRLILIFFLSITFLQAYAQKPSIENIDRRIGNTGVTITISGSGFSSNIADMNVFFGASLGIIETSTENLIEVRVPPGATFDEISVVNLVSGLADYSALPFLLSFGGGNFDPAKIASPVNFQSTTDLNDFCLCDFNADGKNDIATANLNSNVINILNNTSTLQNISFTIIPFAIISKTKNINCRDLDGDGKPEIVVSKISPGDRVLYMQNTSSGATISFNSPQPLIITGDQAQKIEIEDLDNDGKPELIVANESSNLVSIFKNESTIGNISFSAAQTAEIAGPSGTTAIVVNDLNGDGFPEIITARSTDFNVYIAPNHSQPGNINFGTPIVLEGTNPLASLGVADLTGDNRSEVVVTRLTVDANLNNLSIFVFDPGADAEPDGIRFFNEEKFPITVLPWGIDFGDINGDGKVDIVIASIDLAPANKEINVLVNNSTSNTLSLSPEVIIVPEATRNVKVGDIDGDGKPDITVTGIETDQITVLRNKICLEPDILAPDGPITVCEGEEVRITTNNGIDVQYTWFRDDGVTNSQVAQGPQSFLADTPLAGNYTYTVEALSESGDCQILSTGVSVTVISGAVPSPPTISNPGPICEGETLTLTAVLASPPPSLIFIWTAPDGTTSTGQDLIVNNITSQNSGRYLLNLEVNGCQSSTVETLVEVIAVPDVQISSPANTECIGNTIELSVPDDPALNYQWKKDGIDITNENSTTFTASQAGSYSVAISSPNCNFETQSLDITFVALPVASFTIQDGCVGTSIDFVSTSTIATGQVPTFLWNLGDGTTSDEETLSQTYSISGNYNVSLTVSYTGLSCSDVANQTITISDPLPVEIVADSDTTLCEGETVGLSVTGSFTGILWSTGETTSSIIADTSAIYSVEIMSPGGCTNTDEIEVVVFPIPTISITSADTVINLGSSVELIASGAETYSWSPVTGLDNPSAANPLATPDTTTVYSVIGVDANGCEGSAEITITVTVTPPSSDIEAEKAFTPNGDSMNDTWLIAGIENPKYSGCRLIVFDRQGTTVFETQSYSNTDGWDGTSNGKQLPQGAYYWILKCNNEVAKTGSITIIR